MPVHFDAPLELYPTHSSCRYYLNQFRDAYRQAAIDVMTGQPISESLLAAAVHSADAAGEGEDEDEEEVVVPAVLTT